MTLNELLECSAEELEKLTEAELTHRLSPYFTVTRPNLAPKPVPHIAAKPAMGAKIHTPPSFDMAKLQQMIAASGDAEAAKLAKELL